MEDQLKKQKIFRTKNFWWFVIGLSIALVAVFSFYFFKSLPKKNDLIIELSAVKEIVSLDKNVIKLKYSNNSGRDLENIRIKIKYPEQMISTSSEDIFAIDKLGKKEYGERDIEIKVIGDIGSELMVPFMISYKIEGQEISKLDNARFKIDRSVLNIEMELPDNVYSDSVFPFTVSLENDSAGTVDNLKIDFKDLSLKNQEQTIMSLGSFESKKIDLKGKISKLGKKPEARLLVNYRDKEYLQAAASQDVVVENSPLSMEIGSNKYATGGLAGLKIIYKNVSDKTIKDISTLITENDSSSIIKLEGSSDLIIHQDHFDIKKLGPGQEKTLTVEIILKNKYKAPLRLSTKYYIDKQELAWAQFFDIKMILVNYKIR